MSDLLDNYIKDLIYLIKEDYNQALADEEDCKNESDKAFIQGKQIAFYSVLDLIESQLKAFDSGKNIIGEIVPILGEKAKF